MTFLDCIEQAALANLILLVPVLVILAKHKRGTLHKTILGAAFNSIKKRQ